MSQIAIEFQEISKAFNGNQRLAVDSLSLQVEKGDFVTILGTSGSGKTTLLKMVNRIHEPSSGRILMNDKNIAEMEVTDLRRHIGYVIQQIGLFPHMRIEDNIAVVPKIFKWDKKRINERIDELLTLVHLDPRAYRRRYPRQLSGGEQQRVGLARAMAADPEIMLMDEPFGAIDAITRRNLQEELLRIQRQLKKTILFVTHDVEEALMLGDKVIVMHEGVMQQYGRPIDIIMKPANEFVSNLVSAEDTMQRLQFIRVGSVMQTVSATGQQEGEDSIKWVDEELSIKEVVEALIQHNVERLYVRNGEGAIIGTISFEDIRQAGLT